MNSTNTTKPLRPTGTQETVVEQAVKEASARQELAPSAAAPPLVVKSLNGASKRMLIGAPRNPGVHMRAPPPVLETKQYPEADAFAHAQTERKLRVGGFYDVPHGTETIFPIKQFRHMPYLGDAQWKMLMPQVPQSLRPSSNSSNTIAQPQTIPGNVQSRTLRQDRVNVAQFEDPCTGGECPKHPAYHMTPDDGNSRLVSTPKHFYPNNLEYGQRPPHLVHSPVDTSKGAKNGLQAIDRLMMRGSGNASHSSGPTNPPQKHAFAPRGNANRA